MGKSHSDLPVTVIGLERSNFRPNRHFSGLVSFKNPLKGIQKDFDTLNFFRLSSRSYNNGNGFSWTVEGSKFVIKSSETFYGNDCIWKWPFCLPKTFQWLESTSFRDIRFVTIAVLPYRYCFKSLSIDFLMLIKLVFVLISTDGNKIVPQNRCFIWKFHDGQISLWFARHGHRSRTVEISAWSAFFRVSQLQEPFKRNPERFWHFKLLQTSFTKL